MPATAATFQTKFNRNKFYTEAVSQTFAFAISKDIMRTLYVLQAAFEMLSTTIRIFKAMRMGKSTRLLQVA